MMPVSKEVRDQIIALHEHTSKSSREIGSELSISQSTVVRIINLHREKNTVEPYFEANMGRKSKLTEREKRLLVREAKKDPLLTSAEIKRATGPVGSKVHPSTIRRTLLQSGQVSYRPVFLNLFTCWPHFFGLLIKAATPWHTYIHTYMLYFSCCLINQSSKNSFIFIFRFGAATLLKPSRHTSVAAPHR